MFHFVSRNTARAWLAPPNPLEYAAVALYVLAAGLALLEVRKASDAIAGGLLLLMGYIKLDPGGWILSRKLDSLSYYLSDQTPNGERILVVGAWILVCVLAAIFIAPRWRDFLNGLQRKRTVEALVAFAVVVLIVTVVLDRIHESMTWPKEGYATHPDLYFYLEVAEEVLEILIPGALVIALAIRWPTTRSRPAKA